jgi:hypothetical protein
MNQIPVIIDRNQPYSMISNVPTQFAYIQQPGSNAYFLYPIAPQNQASFPLYFHQAPTNQVISYAYQPNSTNTLIYPSPPSSDSSKKPSSGVQVQYQPAFNQGIIFNPNSDMSARILPGSFMSPASQLVQMGQQSFVYQIPQQSMPPPSAPLKNNDKSPKKSSQDS